MDERTFAMIFDAITCAVHSHLALRGGLLRRVLRLAVCGVLLGTAAGCVIAPPPARVGYYHPGVWVPAHWNGWRWIPGHWA